MIEGNPGQIVPQIVGIVAMVVVVAVIGTFIILRVLDAVMGIRVTQDDEIQGLDISQHGEEGYSPVNSTSDFRHKLPVGSLPVVPDPIRGVAAWPFSQDCRQEKS